MKLKQKVIKMFRYKKTIFYFLWFVLFSIPTVGYSKTKLSVIDKEIDIMSNSMITKIPENSKVFVLDLKDLDGAVTHFGKFLSDRLSIFLSNQQSEVCENISKKNGYDILDLVRSKRNDVKHLYYYWMRERRSEIQKFEKEYEDAYNLRYREIRKVLKSIYSI